MNGGMVVAGVLLVGAAWLFASLTGITADQWQLWFSVGIAVGIGGTLVGTGMADR